MRITSQELHPMRVQYTCYMIETETHIYIYEFSNKFDTVLYQFLETGTSDITFMGLDQELK